MANRLAGETSPYLLQHANNPVDWYPWGSEALERARREDKPIFLSIGYAACHWCHVMEHESFENAEIAQLLNDRFVCIKVDREERPDLDQIYMNAVQLLTGHGGWPMSVFLTPDLQPFFGGTYWPPQASRGMPGFDQVIVAVADAWRDRREVAVEQAAEMTRHLKTIGEPSVDGGEVPADILHTAVVRLEKIGDFRHGGFGGAPKFPHSMDLQLVLRAWRRSKRQGLLDLVRLSLDKMARGGIYDQLAGGFARYSVDAQWLVPHFEKMLYDNALLVDAYLDAYQATGDVEYARVARETLDYVSRYMTDPSGGFHSSEDADSEGEEGKFYVWSRQEINDVLGAERGGRFCYVYDVTDEGNFEGHNILNMPKTLAQCASLRGWNADDLQRELAEDRAELLKVRDQRIRPGKDDKILVSWNALMIGAFARAASILDEPQYLQRATAAADFVLRVMRRPDGRLLHSWRVGQAKLDAYLDDYSYLINALVTLYEASFQEPWIDEAVRLAELVLKHFSDARGGFFFTADDHEQLIARNKDYYDGSIPSGNGMAAMAFARLGKLCGRQNFVDAAQRTIASAGGFLQQNPTASAQMVMAIDFLLGPTPELVLVGDSAQDATAQVLKAINKRFLPNRVLACRSSAGADQGSAKLGHLFEGRSTNAAVTLYVCENYTCQAPVTGEQNIIAAIEQL